MNHPIELLVGLGNPGAQYQHTRHNAGEDFVRSFCHRHSIDLKENKSFYGLTAETLVDGQKLRILVPTTFMNRSGQSVAALANFYKIDATKILVAYDELDLEPGTARFKFDGGAGGHNGIKDIISALGNRRDFYRLRLGIGHPGHSSQVTNYVLGKASPDDSIAIEQAMQRADTSLTDAFAGRWEKAMHQLHTREN